MVAAQRKAYDRQPLLVQIVVGYKLREARQTVINPKNKAVRSLSRETVESVVVLAENFPEPEES